MVLLCGSLVTHDSLMTQLFSVKSCLLWAPLHRCSCTAAPAQSSLATRPHADKTTRLHPSLQAVCNRVAHKQFRRSLSLASVCPSTHNSQSSLTLGTAAPSCSTHTAAASPLGSRSPPLDTVVDARVAGHGVQDAFAGSGSPRAPAPYSPPRVHPARSFGERREEVVGVIARLLEKAESGHQRADSFAGWLSTDEVQVRAAGGAPTMCPSLLLHARMSERLHHTWRASSCGSLASATSSAPTTPPWLWLARQCSKICMRAPSICFAPSSGMHFCSGRFDGFGRAALTLFTLHMHLGTS